MQSHEPESWIWRFRGSKTLNRLHLWSSKLIPLFLSPCNKRYKRHLPSDSMLVRKINQNISTHYNMYEMFAWGKGVGIFCCTAYIMIVESFTKNMSHCAEWNWFVNQPLQAVQKNHGCWTSPFLANCPSTASQLAPRSKRNWPSRNFSETILQIRDWKYLSAKKIWSIPPKLTKTPINPNSIESVLLAKILLLFLFSLIIVDLICNRMCFAPPWTDQDLWS